VRRNRIKYIMHEHLIEIDPSLLHHVKLNTKQLQFKVEAKYLSDVIAILPTRVPFGLKQIDGKKGWFVTSNDQDLNGMNLNISYWIPCGIVFRSLDASGAENEELPKECTVCIGAVKC
jgi:hypothetical protein